MGASTQPSASGMPPKTSGWRMRLVLSVGRVVETVLSDTGTPGDLRGRRAPGKGARKSLGRPSGRDAFTGAGRPRTRDGHGGCRGNSLEDVGGEPPAGSLLHEDGGRGALGPAGLGGVDGHVVVQGREDGADERVGGLRLRGELGDGGARAEVD